MKTKIGFSILIAALILALGLASCAQSQRMDPRDLSAAALAMPIQATPLPPEEDQSVIGSTDGIMVMGIVIVAITSLPLILRKRKKKNNPKDGG